MTTQSETKEAIFKRHFVEVLRDLQKDGTEDNEVMAMIGTLAADIAKTLKQSSWSKAKANLTRENYDEMLASFTRRGNEMHQSGHAKQAYAIQALATSLVAATQRRDPDIATGEKLLDGLIDRSIAYVAVVNASTPKH